PGPQGPQGNPGPAGPQGNPGPAGPAGPAGAAFVVAAGRFNADGTSTPPGWSFNNDLNAKRLSRPELYYLTFKDFKPDGKYLIKGTAINQIQMPPHVFEEMIGDSVSALVDTEIGPKALDRG